MTRITSEDVARHAGVSRSVVSAVINGTKGIRVGKQKREAVLKAIDALNYRVDVQARGLKLGRTNCIAVSGHLKNPIFFQVLEGVQRACLECGYHVLLYGSEQDEAKRLELIDLYAERRIDGIITQDYTSYDNEEWENLIKERRIPYVSLEGYPENPAIASVLMDYEESIIMALDYMWEKSSLPPAYLEVFNGPDYRPNWGDRMRLNAYEQWMEKRGLQPDYTAIPKGTWEQRSSMYTAFLQQRQGRTAILANWSQGAIHLYRAAEQAQRKIGRDLRVIAADNSLHVNEHLVPSLTSIQIPYTEMGRAAAFRLFEYIEDRRSISDTEKHLFSPAMLVGESV